MRIKIAPERAIGKESAEVLAREDNKKIDNYIRHLSRGNHDGFYEVWGESKDGHCETLLDSAMRIVFARDNQKLNADIGAYSPFRNRGYVPQNWDAEKKRFYVLKG